MHCQITNWRNGFMPRIADPDQRRAEVVDAAFRLLAREGVESLSMRRVAKEAGCTIGLLNHWFASKDHLMDAALGRAASTAIERCTAILQNPDGTLEKLVSEFLPLDGTRTDELRVWLAFWALSIGRPELKDLHRKRAHGIRQQLKGEARKMADTAPSLTLFVDVLMALLDGITVNALVDPEYWTPARQLRSLRWAIRGLVS